MSAPSLDGIPEYIEMRKGLTALRLEVPPQVADDMLAICERAALTIRDKAYQRGSNDGYAESNK